jgi:hypothetical protein
MTRPFPTEALRAYANGIYALEAAPSGRSRASAATDSLAACQSQVVIRGGPAAPPYT